MTISTNQSSKKSLTAGGTPYGKSLTTGSTPSSKSLTTGLTPSSKSLVTGSIPDKKYFSRGTNPWGGDNLTDVELVGDVYSIGAFGVNEPGIAHFKNRTTYTPTH